MNSKVYSFTIMMMKVAYLLLGAYFLLSITTEYWYYPILGYIFVALCNGAIAHRYFAHNQYKVNKVGRVILGTLATIGAYSPVSYWIIQHKHHHRHSDKETDIHSPQHGLLHAFVFWPFKESVIQSVFADNASKILMVKCYRDSLVNVLSKYFVFVNLAFVIVLGCINWQVLCYAYFTGYVFAFLQLGLINTVCHTNTIGSYRNFNTADNSYNNYLLGLITLGFAWHNNHHADASRLDLRIKWWEVDLEAAFAKLMARVFQ